MTRVPLTGSLFAAVIAVAGVSAPRAAAAPPIGHTLRDSVEVLDDFAALKVKGIPPALLADSHAVVIIPRVIKAGLTGIHDASVSRVDAEAYRRLDRDGKLKLRVHGMASPPSGGEVAFVSRPIPQAWQGDRFKVRSIKLFIDGAMGSSL